MNNFFMEEVFNNLSDTQDYMLEFYEMDSSYLGFLLSLPENEFKLHYKYLKSDIDYLKREAILRFHLQDKSKFTRTEFENMKDVILKKIGLIYLVREGKYKYTASSEDDNWEFERVEI